MRKILAVCLLLGLVLVPATVMAAGPRGQGNGNAQGAAPVLQEQTGTPGTVTGQFQFCARHGDSISGANGNGKMLRIRDCTAAGTQAGTMARNQTRLRDGSCGNCPGQTGAATTT